jgi:hypothetical protein
MQQRRTTLKNLFDCPTLAARPVARGAFGQKRRSAPLNPTRLGRRVEEESGKPNVDLPASGGFRKIVSAEGMITHSYGGDA